MVWRSRFGGGAESIFGRFTPTIPFLKSCVRPCTRWLYGQKRYLSLIYAMSPFDVVVKEDGRPSPDDCLIQAILRVDILFAYVQIRYYTI